LFCNPEYEERSLDKAELFFRGLSLSHLVQTGSPDLLSNSNPGQFLPEQSHRELETYHIADIESERT
jgi:hypothetical protein